MLPASAVYCARVSVRPASGCGSCRALLSAAAAYRDARAHLGHPRHGLGGTAPVSYAPGPLVPSVHDGRAGPQVTCPERLDSPRGRSASGCPTTWAVQRSVAAVWPSSLGRELSSAGGYTPCRHRRYGRSDGPASLRVRRSKSARADILRCDSEQDHGIRARSRIRATLIPRGSGRRICEDPLLESEAPLAGRDGSDAVQVASRPGTRCGQAGIWGSGASGRSCRSARRLSPPPTVTQNAVSRHSAGYWRGTTSCTMPMPAPPRGSAPATNRPRSTAMACTRDM